MSTEAEITKPKNQNLNFSINTKWLSLLLIALIVAMLAVWRPWQASNQNGRTIDVSGQAVIKAEPNQYIFYPSYEFKNMSKEEAVKAVTAKSDEVVKKLKQLGVADSKIKTNASSYDQWLMYSSSGSIYNLSITVTLDDKTKAQAVQDYLLTTNPSGQITPQPNFSTDKQRQLESQGRDAATKDARSKAEQMAKNLGVKLGSVKSISDSGSFGGGGCYGRICPMADAKASAAIAETSHSSLSLQPGENELNYSIGVTYYLK